MRPAKYGFSEPMPGLTACQKKRSNSLLSGSTSKAWEELFRVLNLQQKLQESQLAVVTADVIKTVTRREPRLMTKFDTRESRPRILEGVTLLPLSNGEYALLQGDGYCDVPNANLVKVWSKEKWRSDLVTLPWETGPNSESQALDMASASGILDDFFEDSNTRLTIRGRLRCPRFEFRFRCDSREIALVANGVQVEVDSGFEGEKVHLIEAKLGNRANFHQRQLYFPLRMWSTLVEKKPAVAVFLTWSNRCVSLRGFAFDPLDLYQSQVPVTSVDYLLDEPESLPNLAELLDGTREHTGEIGTPFPQADDMRRVIDCVDAIGSGLVSRSSLATHYGFAGRQADYYANAAVYLSLLEKSERSFKLSALGHRFATATLNVRHELLLRQMVSRPVFRQVAQKLVLTGRMPTLDDVTQLVANRTRLTRVTSMRRAKTVIAWLRWAEHILDSNSNDPLAPRAELSGQYRLFRL